MGSPATLVATVVALIPFLTEGFFPGRLHAAAERMPRFLAVLAPAALCSVYLLVACAAGRFRWGWFAMYALLPCAVAYLLREAAHGDPEQRGTWRDYAILLSLGLAVDLRWFEPAWPARLALFNKVLLLDAGIYGFCAMRQLSGVGFDLRLTCRDFAVGLRELTIYAPVAIALGLALGFLHLNLAVPWARRLPFAALFTFFSVAVPEELFFRGWLQNLLERRFGRVPALLATAVVFGLAHFNKRAAHFNWRYVVLAALAGVAYGRAWRQQRRVGASSITHAGVDTIWSLWLR